MIRLVVRFLVGVSLLGLAGAAWWLLQSGQRGADIVRVIGGAVAVVAMVFAISAGTTLDRQHRMTVVPPSLDDQVENLRRVIKESGPLVAEINAEVRPQRAALDRIRAEAEDNKRLAALHREATDAIGALAATMEDAYAASARRGRRQQ